MARRESDPQEKQLQLNDQQTLICIAGAPFIASSETLRFPSPKAIKGIGLGICPMVVNCKNQPDDSQSEAIIILSPFIMFAKLFGFKFPFQIEC